MVNLEYTIDLEQKPVCRFVTEESASERHHCRTYTVPELWCVHLYNFSGTLTTEEGCIDIYPGDVGFIPPNKTVTYAVYGQGSHICAHFSLPVCEKTSKNKIPSVMKTGSRFSEFYASFHSLYNLFEANQHAVDIKLWSILLEVEHLYRTSQRREDVLPQALDRCLKYIDRNLNMPLTVVELVGVAEISHTYLLKLFKQHLSFSITEYIQQKRMNKAHYLLTNTTQSVKSIAIDCGYTDLQYFNKCVRRAFGSSPRKLRSL